MKDLTGAPAYEYIIDRHENMFEIIEESHRMQYSITCGSLMEDKDHKMKEIGIVNEHSYAIIDAQYITDT